MTKRILPTILILLLLLQTTACAVEAPPEGTVEQIGGFTDVQPNAVYAEAAACCKEEISMTKINVSFNDHTYPATLADNSSAQAFAQLLQENGGSLTIDMSDYGGFEKVGSLGTLLPRNDEPVTTSAGDIILYQGNSITVYYAQNSWNFTRLGRLDDPSGLRDALGSGDVAITFALA